MIPLSHHGSSRDLSEKIITYSAELIVTASGTYSVFTHYHRKRFVPIEICTFAVYNPTATISLTFGKVASVSYNEWSAAAQLLSTNSWVIRTLANPSQNRSSFGIGDTMNTVVTYSLGSGTVSFKTYIRGVLVGT